MLATPTALRGASAGTYTQTLGETSSSLAYIHVVAGGLSHGTETGAGWLEFDAAVLRGGESVGSAVVEVPRPQRLSGLSLRWRRRSLTQGPETKNHLDPPRW